MYSADLPAQVRALDLQCEQVVQLCTFCRSCTTSLTLGQSLRSLGAVLEVLEPELVPCLLSLYLQPEDPGARAAVRLLRGVWRRLVEELAGLVQQLVDPTAYCVVLAEEAESLGLQIRGELYSQEGARLGGLLERLVAMAEAGVDLAWRGLGEKGAGTAPLEEDHPLVRAERSVWEVRASARLVTANVADLSLHQSALRRVRVLVTALQELVTCLAEQEDSGCEAPATSPGLLSFRAKTHLDKTAAVAEESRREVYRLVHDLSPYSPGPSQLRRSSRGTRSARRSSARLDSVLGQLSSLHLSLTRPTPSKSHDISLRRLVLRPQPVFSSTPQDPPAPLEADCPPRLALPASPLAVHV